MGGSESAAVGGFCSKCGAAVAGADAAYCARCGAPRLVPASRTLPAQQADTLGLFLVLLPLVGIALCWLWVGNSNLLSAGSNLGVTFAIVIIGTAVLAAVDASKLGLGVPGGPAEKESGPVATFVATAFLWLFCYPMYMFRRARYGGRKYGGAAVAGALVFVISAVMMLGAIEVKKEEIREAFGEFGE